MADDMEERIMVVPLRKILDAPRTKRAPRAIKLIRSHVARHMKISEEDVWLDTPINEAVWGKGIEHPPNKIKIKATKFKDQDLVEVTLPEE
ncbi:MAG TPA: 50S ribosomal protein L31e [Euryarchaeota archaeon]|nr:MAG: 50S ribosomal protein L31e [Thermoplasmatales archaeon ex4484_6]RLF65793.1 MAG: 50S ribosomal protein L31e [Thermoplasmata archaeon]HHD15270.1 50S ribosomal protein L31e [Euryarchaeota archaeon]